MSHPLLTVIRLWNRTAGHGLFVALLDVFFLSLAVYLGYAIRLSLFIPELYLSDCLRAALAFSASGAAVFALGGQYRILWTQAGFEDYLRFETSASRGNARYGGHLNAPDDDRSKSVV